MILEIFPYSLIPIARRAGPRRGAILQVSLQSGNRGYADLFPWPELGDPSLDDLLGALRKGLTDWHPLLVRSLEFATLDAEARFQQRSLFSGLEIPLSHFFCTDLVHLGSEEIRKISDQGFKEVKVKLGSRMGLNIGEESRLLFDLLPAFIESGLKLRLDFNGSLTVSLLDRFLEGMGEWILSLDFIEDPVPYDAQVWSQLQRKWGIRLALDWYDKKENGSLDSDSFSVLVIKPARENWRAIAEFARQTDRSVMVTSYLDHPLGQMTAAWAAAQLKLNAGLKMESCGLLSQTAYKPHLFSEVLQTEGPRILSPQGFGFGFDSLWSTLC